MDNCEIKEYEGRIIYFSGEKFGLRGVVFDGNCYTMERGTENDRALLEYFEMREVIRIGEIEEPWDLERQVVVALENKDLIRGPNRVFEVRVPRRYSG